MSDQKEHKPFVNFTEKEWIEYLSHRMQPEKEAEFNRLSKQQEFTADALEGIDSATNRSHVLSTINQINQKVKERSGKSTGYTMKSNEFNYIRIGAIAAVFIILIGIGSAVIYFMNNTHNSSVASVTAESTENPESLLPPDVASDAAVSALQPADSSAALANTAAMDSVKTPIIKSNSTVAANTQPKPTPGSTGTSVDAAKTPPLKNKNLVAVAETKEPATTNARLSESRYTSAADMEASSATVSPNSPPLSQVIAEKKVAIPREEQNSSISQYQKGVEEMNRGNNDEALRSFDNVISQNSGFKVDAKWNKAQILIKKGESKKAIKILKELAENENPYKNKAKELIKSLE